MAFWAGLVMATAGLTLPMGCGATDDRPAAWPYISPAILQPSCATVSCHSRATAAAGLDFSSPSRGYASLTALPIWIVDPDGAGADGCRTVDGTVVCERAYRPLVIAYNPAESRLVNMLRARGAPRMPPDRPLPELDIALIERWILDGARETTAGPPAPIGGGALDASAAAPGDAGDAGGGDRDGDGADPDTTVDRPAPAADGRDSGDGGADAGGDA